MKTVVINFSGNVGKSTVARHLLAPRLNAKVFPVESINSDGTDDEKIKGKQFADLMDGLAMVENAVVDVGSSNVEEFVKLINTITIFAHHEAHALSALYQMPFAFASQCSRI